ncbi:MAG: hypothetical protein J6A21_02765, partial [Lentisphaeria bacterium]|nr:hypothetical protein [Lentisphaeria bacterium]
MKAKKASSAKIPPPQGGTETLPSPEGTTPPRRPLAFLAEIYVLFLTFCLPLKFGTLIGVPEIPATYWDSFVGIFAASWPVLTFPVFSGLGLALTLLFAYPRKFRYLSMTVLA